jgi:hypothetical protein
MNKELRIIIEMIFLSEDIVPLYRYCNSKHLNNLKVVWLKIHNN